MNADLIHPYLFLTAAVEKPWAGSKLVKLFPGLSAHAPQGTGEIVCLGENEDFSLKVAHGPAKGKPLKELENELGCETLYGNHDSLPVMLKLLDTAATLSVQVHPEDVTEQGRLIKRGKAEAWYVLAAEPDAYIWQGVQPGVDSTTFWKAIEDGTPENVLIKREIVVGDCIFSPARIAHAIGDGITLIELQQNSNTTYRMYDWERSGTREMHIDKAKQAIKLELSPPAIVNAGDFTTKTLCENQHFQWLSHRINSALTFDTPGMHVFTMVQGKANVTWPRGDFKLEAPHSILIPHACKDVTIEGEGECHLLEARA